jgi:hypothetical protein
VEAPTLALAVQSPKAASHMSALGRPLVGLVATNYIQVIVEQIRYTSCVLQNKLQNVTSTYREKSLILGLEACIILVPLLLVLRQHSGRGGSAAGSAAAGQHGGRAASAVSTAGRSTVAGRAVAAADSTGTTVAHAGKMENEMVFPDRAVKSLYLRRL